MDGRASPFFFFFLGDESRIQDISRERGPTAGSALEMLAEFSLISGADSVWDHVIFIQ